MEPTDVPESQLPAPWNEVLTRVEQALAQAVHEAALREEAISVPPDAPSSQEQRAAAWRERLARLEERLRGLERGVKYAGGQAADIEVVLATEETVVRQWLGMAGASQRRLADWAGRSV